MKHLAKEYSMAAATLYDLKEEKGRCGSFMVTAMTRNTKNREITSEGKK